MLSDGPQRPALRLRQRRLRRGEPRDGHAIGRAADVVEAYLFEEVDRRRVSAVLTADAQLDPRPTGASFGRRDLDELADPRLVDRGERVLLHDLELRVLRQ